MMRPLEYALRQFRVGLMFVGLLSLALCGADCGNEPAKKLSGESPRPTLPTTQAEGAPATQGVQVSSDPHLGVDDDDAPDAPRSLPRTGFIPGWVKSKPVRVYAPMDALQALPNSSLATVLPLFKTQRVMTCQYTFNEIQADLILVEAPPFDALGLYCLLTTHPRPITGVEGAARGTRKAFVHVRTAWEGGMYLELSVPGQLHESTLARVDQLLERIIFSHPSAEPPLLFQIIPKDRRDHCRVWFVRTTRALELLKLPGLQGFDAARLDKTLGLHDGATLSLAAVDVIPGEPHLIWVAEYASAEAAEAAYSRYSEVIRRPVTDLDRTTLLEKPRTRYLAGTWTRRQESLQSLLPAVAAALPELTVPLASTQPSSAPAGRP